MAQARIYRPAKSAMTSGRRNSRHWVLEFETDDRSPVDPLMGWAGTTDTRRQIRLRFPSKEAALAYAERHGIPYHLLPEHNRRPIRRSYADNFS